MGCGQGSWLAYLHRLIADETARGRHLGEQPLLMIGVDPDPTALGEAEAALAAAGVPALLLRGDVTDPDALRGALAERGIAIEDGLHIRSFIDHERSYRGGDPSERVPDWSSGIYLDGAGAPLAAADVERDLVAHLRRWAPHVRRHGMVVLEAHCTAPEVVARNLGAMHGLAFDSHQAYSKQYTVDHGAWLECCRRPACAPSPRRKSVIRPRRPFVSISLNRLLAAEPVGGLLPPAAAVGAARRATGDPTPTPTSKTARRSTESSSAAATSASRRRGAAPPPASSPAAPWRRSKRGWRRSARARRSTSSTTAPGPAPRRSSCWSPVRERGLDRRFDERGAELVVHLVDLPSAWYAKGHELLGGQGARPGSTRCAPRAAASARSPTWSGPPRSTWRWSTWSST